MDNRDELAERFRKEKWYAVDPFPMRVPRGADGQFFEVEHHYLSGTRRVALGEHFTGVMLKLMCFFHVVVRIRGEWDDRPSPGSVARAVTFMMEKQAGEILMLFPEEDALLRCDWDSLHLTVYHPSEAMLSLLPQLAASEGFFLWKSE